MKLARVAFVLSMVALLPSRLRADDSSVPGNYAVREFRLEHVEAKDANVIVRSLLDVRKVAIDERREVLILGDSPENLERAARLLAQIDVAPPPWAVRLVARVDGQEIVLRTASLTQGSLDVHFGPQPVTTQDNLGITVSIRRAASGEIDLEWSAALAMSNQWTESARAVETLHDGAEIMLVNATDHARRRALAHLLGLAGEVESIGLEITQGGAP